MSRPDIVKRSHFYIYNLYFFLEHFLGYKLLQRFFNKRINQLNDTVLKDIQSKEREIVLEVPQVEKEIINSSDKSFRKIMHKPLLFKGAAKDWPATQKWSLDFFEKEFGDFEIFVLDTVGAIDKKKSPKV